MSMRYQGRISQWNDSRGYGFVVPNGGGERAFVHIKAFQSAVQRPIDGDLIIYQLIKDANNRNQAINIRFANMPRSSSVLTIVSKKLLVLMGVASIIAGMVLMSIYGWLAVEWTLIYGTLSLFTFIVYAFDKSAAKHQRQRTPENTLHLLSLLGGWPGALLAQQYLRHKSKKREFLWVFGLTIILNLSALLWLQTQQGQSFVRSIIGS